MVLADKENEKKSCLPGHDHYFLFFILVAEMEKRAIFFSLQMTVQLLMLLNWSGKRQRDQKRLMQRNNDVL